MRSHTLVIIGVSQYMLVDAIRVHKSIREYPWVSKSIQEYPWVSPRGESKAKYICSTRSVVGTCTSANILVYLHEHLTPEGKNLWHTVIPQRWLTGAKGCPVCFCRKGKWRSEIEPGRPSFFGRSKTFFWQVAWLGQGWCRHFKTLTHFYPVSFSQTGKASSVIGGSYASSTSWVSTHDAWRIYCIQRFHYTAPGNWHASSARGGTTARSDVMEWVGALSPLTWQLCRRSWIGWVDPTGVYGEAEGVWGGPGFFNPPWNGLHANDVPCSWLDDKTLSKFSRL